MRDFTTNEYCDYLWINDLLSLKKGPNDEYVASVKKSGKEKTVTISNVIVIGTVVEMKEIGERGILYSVDDGTGIITCKYSDKICAEIFDVIHEEERQILNDSFSKTGNQSEISYTMSDDDTIFNDKTLQEEEAVALQKNMLKGLHSVWVDVEDSFSNMMGLNIGDSVIIHGRLYSYFHINQIHVNIIRQIDLQEMLFLTHFKLADGYEPVGGTENVNSDFLDHIHLVENSRRSGIMTFDHIQHLDVKEIPSSKFIISKEKNQDERQIKMKKRKSVIMPHLHGTMTFDTFEDLNDSASGPKYKLMKR